MNRDHSAWSENFMTVTWSHPVLSLRGSCNPFGSVHRHKIPPSLFSDLAQYWIALWQNHLTLARLCPPPSVNNTWRIRIAICGTKQGAARLIPGALLLRVCWTVDRPPWTTVLLLFLFCVSPPWLSLFDVKRRLYPLRGYFTAAFRTPAYIYRCVRV